MQEEKVKYNLGGGPKKMNGYKNVDALAWKIVEDLPGMTDILWDLTKVPYEFAKEDSVDELMAVELLEHISFRDTMKVLKEWHRILKPGGTIQIQVPDCGKMMEYYVEKKICGCVPHKAKNWKSFSPREGCWDCNGKAVINPNRWLFAFTGAQKHPYDTHKSVFTRESLEENLIEAGFTKVDFKHNIYKLVVVCTK